MLDLVLTRGKGVFFRGPTGTGRLLLLRKIIKGPTIKYLKDSHRRIAVTASTGLAAYSVSGTTPYCFAGIGLGKAPTTKFIIDIFRDLKFRIRRWIEVKILINDKISMINSSLVDKLDMITRTVLGINLLF